MRRHVSKQFPGSGPPKPSWLEDGEAMVEAIYRAVTKVAPELFCRGRGGLGLFLHVGVRVRVRRMIGCGAAHLKALHGSGGRFHAEVG